MSYRVKYELSYYLQSLLVFVGTSDVVRFELCVWWCVGGNSKEGAFPAALHGSCFRSHGRANLIIAIPFISLSRWRTIVLPAVFAVRNLSRLQLGRVSLGWVGFHPRWSSPSERVGWQKRLTYSTCEYSLLLLSSRHTRATISLSIRRWFTCRIDLSNCSNGVSNTCGSPLNYPWISPWIFIRLGYQCIGEKTRSIIIRASASAKEEKALTKEARTDGTGDIRSNLFTRNSVDIFVTNERSSYVPKKTPTLMFDAT